MASHVFVQDASLRRTQIKVTPGKYLGEVLEEACAARKWKAEHYTLKTQAQKAVDLSQPFRLAGLSAGAKLQLVQASRSPSVVSLALQLPESEGGGRLSHRFASTTSLWQVLRQFEDAAAGGQAARKLNLTQRGVPSSAASSRSGRLVYEQPCLHLTGRNLDTFAELQKTLGQLGLNGGTVLARLAFRNEGRPLEEAMDEIGRFFSGVDSVAAGVGSSASQGAHTAAPDGAPESTTDAAAATDNAAMPDETSGPEAIADENTPSSPAPTTKPTSDHIPASPTEPAQHPTEPAQHPPDPPTQSPETMQGLSVFLPPTHTTPIAATLAQPDSASDYEVTIAHAKAHQAALTRASRPTRLPSSAELAAQTLTRRAHLATIHSVTVRVRYPDQSIVETALPASATGTELYDRVRGTLAHAHEPFALRFAGDKGLLRVVPELPATLLVRDLGWRGRVLVTMGWVEGSSAAAREGAVLAEAYQAQARELRVDLGEGEEEPEPEPEREGESGGAPVAEKGGGDVEAKMKKFLGFGRKK